MQFIKNFEWTDIGLDSTHILWLYVITFISKN